MEFGVVHYNKKTHTNGAQRQRPLALNLRQQAVTVKKALCLFSLSVSLSLSLVLYSRCTLLRIQQQLSTLSHTLYNMFPLSHIFSDMTIRLFTNIAPMGSQKHIYKYVPSSGERFSPGLHHPALVGSSPSGSHGICLAGYSYLIRRD